MRLREIQENFKDIILDPAQLDKTLFRQDQGICLENRMKVYRNNVMSSLTDAVLAGFPLTQKLVGKPFLEQAARLYVADNLPAAGNLNGYGKTFPAFMRSYE